MSTSRRLLSAVVAVASVAVLAPAGAQAQGATCADVDLAASAATAERVAAAVGCLVNAERAVRGLAPLDADPRLAAAATGFAGDMLAQDFFDHEGPDGSTPGSRATAHGYGWSSIGENIALGQGTPREVMTAWMRSEGHCANVLGAGFTQLGVGLAASGRKTLWVQDFGRPRGVAAPSSADPSGACPASGLSSSAASGGSGEAGASTGSGTGGNAGTGAGGSTPTSSNDGSGSGSGADGTDGTPGGRLTFTVERLRGGTLRVSGSLTGVGRRAVRIEVRRGVRRTVRVVRTAGRFSVRVKGTRGARVTVSAAGAKRTVKVS